jgi:hypothetical protein
VLHDLAAAAASMPSRQEISSAFAALASLFADRPRKRHPKPYRVSSGPRTWHAGRAIYA